ncbi:hypothetical protein NA57DRAFT_29656 [Rhizodiscina lignyota]|uniref:F-box domain-containing protein n=1 Tax=Rhizodiscina lignyota TaxID=1504668 RepID=A0A9P4IU69_9PEZI|nr:hypothetical protein NA57DRAFT_29656 [Rhizodiscina lignyota]
MAGDAKGHASENYLDDWRYEKDGVRHSPTDSPNAILRGRAQATIKSALIVKEKVLSGANRAVSIASATPQSSDFDFSEDGDEGEEDTRYPSFDDVEHLDPDAILLYQFEASNGGGSDVWPDMRDPKKLPAKYVPLVALAPPTDYANRLQELQDVCNQESSSTILAKPASSGSPPQCPVRSGRGWPAQKMPAELYDLIIGYLPRDEIKAMRLACKEFEKHVSHALFSTVVVPFNTEIYGMLEVDSEPAAPIKRDVKGKGKARASDFGTVWKNANCDDIYTGHGIDVYRGFGPHIQRYGMSFEVDEEILARPPKKTTMELHDTYWGHFPWPYQNYRRFDHVANLESAADETPKMKQAFSYLKKVKELALSIDSGLGWLNGPDLSMRSRILKGPSTVFGSSHAIADRQMRAKRGLWKMLEDLHNGMAGACNLRHAKLRHVDFKFTIAEFQALAEEQTANGLMSHDDINFVNDNLIRDAHSHNEPDSFLGDTESPLQPGRRGALYTIEDMFEGHLLKRHALVPNDLTKLQREWLLETEWAQRAFLSSYMVAIIDNPKTFENVHTINFSRISSRYLHSLCRDDFWSALPNLHTVIIKVIADWRTVEKDPAGFVHTPMEFPSEALRPFYKLLQNFLAPMENIKTLQIGWASGGEYAEGVHARNRHLLPAPVLPSGFMADGHPSRERLEETVIAFPHVEHLTLANCWIPPLAFTTLVMKHESACLNKLTLDSVSLSPLERANAGQNANNQGVAPPPPLNAQPVGPGVLPAIQNQNQNNNNIGAQQPWQLPAPPPIANPLAPTLTWRGPHRSGSWPYVLDIISPGKNLGDYPYTTSNADNARIAASTLTEIELISCGYARIQSRNFDNSSLDSPAPHVLDPHFQKRREALASCVMTVSDTYLGEIVQYMPQHEIRAASTVWNVWHGWQDVAKADEATFDGLLPGGTGRISGVIKRSDRDELEMP